MDLQASERETIIRALERNAGNMKRTAQERKTARSTLQRKLKEWGIADDGEDAEG